MTLEGRDGPCGVNADVLHACVMGEEAFKGWGGESSTFLGSRQSTWVPRRPVVVGGHPDVGS